MDVTGDGIADIISGCYVADEERSKGIAHQYVIAGKADGTFAKAVPIKTTDGKPLVLPGSTDRDRYHLSSICTHPFASDWDGDGDLDLLIGNFQGTFYLAENVGIAAKPSWQAEGTWIKDPNGSELLLKQRHSAPFVIDWDSDGDLDILSGTASGGVQWAENSGTRQRPSFLSFQQLVAPPQRSPNLIENNEDIVPSRSTRIWVADVNDDGIHDLLVGDNATLRRKKNGLSEEEFTRLVAAYDAEGQELQKIGQELGGTADKNSAEFKAYDQRSRNHYASRTEFLDTERTGFVWLYLGR